ncbi:MAG: hypothetical protein GXO78_01870 [Calditrichaeota bacterium]|nr:hypothetical protein [Calditrichota bacterium]
MKKLKHMLSEWPHGAVFSSHYLRQKGIKAEHLKRYRKSGWIVNVARGAYKLAGDHIDWMGAVYGLQQEKNVHIGGKTALELKGYGHFITFSLRTVFLYSSTHKTLPRWFKNNDWGVKIHFSYLHLFQVEIKDSYTRYDHNSLNLKISAPERAFLEMLSHIPQKQSFDEAMKIMESLTTLRPELIQRLLELCRSIKVKRLFLYMAEKHNHFWFSHLDLSRIDLGRGNRSIVKNGLFNKKYRITVPGEFEN